MKRLLLSLLTCCCASLLYAQQKSFELYAVAEGNFGTPNGDIFKVTKGSDSMVSVSPPLYQTANNATAGFNVIQDFEVFGNKAVWGTKAGSSKIVIANYPGFDSIRTISVTGVQCLGIASSTKAYISGPSGNSIRMVDLTSGALTSVTIPSGTTSSYANFMIAANGFMYAAISDKIVKIDTGTNLVASIIQSNLGTISGLQYDTATKHMWILGKSGGTSALVKMEVLNNDLLNTPVILTGVTNAAQLRFSNQKLYFLSGKSVHIYNILSPNIPTTAVYTSTLGGSASAFAFAYGKAFAVDPVSGDFVIGHAVDFASSSLYEIIDGATFNVIATGSITGCRIVNELMLKINPQELPVPNTITLPVIHAQCSVTLTPPTASSGATVINGTTTDPVTYHAQGSYTVHWTYTNTAGSVTQTQQVIIADTTAPVPDSASLPALTVSCPYTIAQYPTATDNCIGTITASTTSPLTYTTGGTYIINWRYTDSSANTTIQTQTIVVDCAPSSVAGTGKTFSTRIWPNPASDQLWIDSKTSSAGIRISLKDVIGRELIQQTNKQGISAINISNLPSGVYYVMVQEINTNNISVQKIIINH